MPIRTIFFVILALIIQYVYLQGSLTASPYQSSKSFSNYYKSLKYMVDEYTVRFEVPATTEVHLTPDKGQEMRLNIYFLDSGLSLRGYIQVWIINDLKYFLSNSKSLSPFDFVSYRTASIIHNNKSGIKEEWTANFGEKYISANEYWFTSNTSGEVLRVSFFTDDDEFPDELLKIAQYIANSLEIDTNKS